MNPVLVEVTRGDGADEIIESRHRGTIVTVDGEGKTLFSYGDVSRPVFPRSSIKALQALVLIESGAADAYALSDEEIALACASHSGEAGHIATAQAILAKCGLNEDALECGAHWPLGPTAARDLAASGGQKSPACNNCSGKHAGFLCAACHLGMDHNGYVQRDHEVQKLIRATLTEMTGIDHNAAPCGTDGCSIPTYAIPLDAFAAGFAKFATGIGLSEQRAKACKRIHDACTSNPWFVAGTKRFCTRIMEASKGRVFAKTGAEGVFIATIADQGISVAVKCDDGGTRASEVMVAAGLAKALPKDDPLQSVLEDFHTMPITNWNGIQTGMLQSVMPQHTS